MRVAIVYRVIPGWRVGLFERMSKVYDLKVFFGCDFPGTKVVSVKGNVNFNSKEVMSIPLLIKKKSGNIAIPFSPALFFELKKFNPDVVVCEGASNFINNIIVYVYCIIYKKPMVQWGLGKLRGKKDGLLRRFFNVFIQPIEKRASAIIAYSSYGAEYYRTLGIAPDKIHVAVNVVDTDKRLKEIELVKSNAQIIGNRNKSFKILFIGALESNKNVDVLIRAFEMVLKSGREAQLHIVGGGMFSDDLKVLADSIGLKGDIIFHGAKNGEVASLILDMDVFVMPGLGGLAVSDMLCHGIPVICGVGDGCEADLIDGTNGKIIGDMTEESIAEEIINLIDDPDRLYDMKIAARNTIKSYNITSYMDNVCRAIDSSVGEKK